MPQNVGRWSVVFFFYNLVNVLWKFAFSKFFKRKKLHFEIDYSLGADDILVVPDEAYLQQIFIFDEHELLLSRLKVI